jgi:hypothetical protein
MRVRSVPEEARIEVSVWLNLTVLMVSTPQERVVVG